MYAKSRTNTGTGKRKENKQLKTEHTTREERGLEHSGDKCGAQKAYLAERLATNDHFRYFLLLMLYGQSNGQSAKHRRGENGNEYYASNNGR